MAIDTTSPRARRAILLGALGAAVASAAAVVGRASPVNATDGDPMVVGNTYTSSSPTEIISSGGVDTIYGRSLDTGTGVHGESISGYGVNAVSSSGAAVEAISGSGRAIRGISSGNVAVLGQNAANQTGVQGFSNNASGAAPTAPAKTGVWGFANQDRAAVGVKGQSPLGRGVVAAGGTAQLRLVPSTAASHPLSGAAGDLFLDNTARLWLCTKGGNPATWNQVQLV